MNPERSIAFEDSPDGPRAVAVEDFRYPGEPDPAPTGPDPVEAVRRILELVAGDVDAVQAGRRALLMAHVLKAPGHAATQRQLADRMKLSPARVNTILRVFRRELAEIAPAE